MKLDAPPIVTCKDIVSRDYSTVIAPPAWRVAFASADLVHGCDLAISIEFRREKDAEIALKALTAAGITNAGEAIKVGGRRLREIMCEALQW